MKARGLNKIMKEDREVCANHLLTTLTAEEAARLALWVFPVGAWREELSQVIRTGLSKKNLSTSRRRKGISPTCSPAGN